MKRKINVLKKKKKTEKNISFGKYTHDFRNISCGLTNERFCNLEEVKKY